MSKLELKQIIREELFKELEFGSKEEFSAYKEKHQMRPSTKVKIAGKNTTVANASDGKISNNKKYPKNIQKVLSGKGKKYFQFDLKDVLEYIPKDVENKFKYSEDFENYLINKNKELENILLKSGKVKEIGSIPTQKFSDYADDKLSSKKSIDSLSPATQKLLKNLAMQDPPDKEKIKKIIHSEFKKENISDDIRDAKELADYLTSYEYYEKHKK